MIKARKGILGVLTILTLLAIFINIAAADTTPPASISNLKNISYSTTYINWTWKDPSNSDFAKVIVYIDGVWKKNVTKGTKYYKATSLLPNTSHTISTHTVDTSGNVNKTWKNHTAWTKRDSTYPISITGLKNVSYAPTYINWTWTDSISTDFAKVIVYIDGIFKAYVNKGVKYYNATGLSPNTNHQISTHTVDTSGNINKTWVNDTKRTAPQSDTIAPKSITGLHNITYQPNYINWTWTDPTDSDFSKVVIYIDGVSKGYVNKGIRYYNATGFLPDTSHKISTHTIDTSGNINSTWINDTERTVKLSIPPPVTTTSNLGVFYYPWTGGNSTVSPTGTWRHWLDDGHNPPSTWASNYLPDVLLTGIWNPNSRLYSSKDIGTIDRQFGLIKKSGIGFVISSWWGQNSYEDQALSIVVNNVVPNYVGNVNFTIYYEKEGFNPIPESEIINDIDYIKNKYANSPSFLKINGKPVIFVYNIGGGGETDLQKAQKWKRVRDATGIYTVLKVFDGYQNNVNLADSWHQYAPAHAGGFEQQGSYSAFITPGFDRYDPSSGTPSLERENFVRWDNNAAQLKNTNVQFKLIETWNEWGEGTGIEPAQKINHNDGGVFTPAADSYGTKYIDILSKYFST